MEEVNKNTELDNIDKKLHISDVRYSNIKKYFKILYHFKSIKFKQYRYDKNGNLLNNNGNIETIVNLNIKDKCDGTFVTEHKYSLISWCLMLKKYQI